MNRYIITMTSGKEYVMNSAFSLCKVVEYIKLDDEYYVDESVIFTHHIESIEQVDSVVE